ncbi:PRC-barrel domain protein [Planctomycetes bacterium Poly30]|uniref:PRC-barrel domain protein n=1 Tax=Saltatorellus ferox TaxID=2528018 RepID=A0A518ERC9_9BACT|nr:PRC-barrel domain protein [Planctomycetes bacterium Poly30]
MKTQRLSIALAACLIGTSAVSFSQEPVKTPDQKPARQRRVDGAEAEAGRPGMGQRNLFLPSTEVMGHAVTAMAGEAAVELGTVANLVVDTKDGSISHVIIQGGEKTSQPGQLRAVPFDALNWSAGEDGKNTAVLDLDPRAFDATPAFDPTMIDQLTGSSAVDAAAKRLGDAGKDMTDEQKAEMNKKAREATAGAVRSVLATNLAGVGVRAKDERQPFSRLSNLIVDCGRGQIAFATVVTGEGNYLVPFQVLEVASTPGADGAAATYSVIAPTNAEGMVGAPMINADAEETASNPRFRASVYKHYGVDAPMGRRGKKRDGDMERGEGPGKERARAPKEGKTRKIKKDDGGR